MKTRRILNKTIKKLNKNNSSYILAATNSEKTMSSVKLECKSGEEIMGLLAHIMSEILNTEENDTKEKKTIIFDSVFNELKVIVLGKK